MVIERTSYYAKEGHVDDVIDARRAACDVRRRMGLSIGSLRVRVDGDGPDVIWECSFPSVTHQSRDLAARDASTEFAEVRRRMDSVISRFERIVEESAAPISGHWAGDRDLDAYPIQPEEIHFKAAGSELVGYLYRPPGTGPFPCVVTNHGSGIQHGTTDLCRPAAGALLMSWGVASFLPHRHGYGRSAGRSWLEEVTADKGSKEWSEQLALRLEHESDDIVEALHCIEAHDDIDGGHIAFMGSSFGGITTLLAAAKCNDCRCAVDFAGAAMTWEQAPHLRELMLAAVARLAHPIMFVQAATDYSIAPTEVLPTRARVGQVVESKVYPAWGLTQDEGHLFESRGMQIWGPDVRRFLEQWL